MSNLALPQRGQPLDVSYIGQIVEQVNRLSESQSQQTNNYVTIDTASSGPITVKTEGARIVGGYKNVTRGTSTTAGAEVSSSYTYSDFKYAPIITATPIILNTTNTTASKDVTVVLTSVTTNRVDFTVKFSTVGVSSVGVNLLIIGIPV